MKPNARKENEALYKQRHFKTIGDIMNFDPLSRFIVRQYLRSTGKSKHWNGHHGLNNKQNHRPTKSHRTEGRFLKLNAFKLVHNLPH